jgi:hypothetical protein
MRLALSLALASGLVVWHWTGGSLPQVKETAAGPPKLVAANLQQVLAKKSLVVVREGKEVLQLWIREVVPTTATAEPVPYASIVEGTFLGIVEIKPEADLTDFRNQALDPGVYTMRLGIQPQDGNHMGVAPSNEFICLSRAADDKKLDPLPHDTLMKQSGKVAGSHPAVLFLQPFFEKPKYEFPLVNKNSSDHTVLNIKTGATLKDDKKAELTIGIVIVGVTDAA